MVMVQAIIGVLVDTEMAVAALRMTVVIVGRPIEGKVADAHAVARKTKTARAALTVAEVSAVAGIQATTKQP